MRWSLYLEAVAREHERSLQREPRLFARYTENGTWELLDVDFLSSWQGESDGMYEHGNWTAGFWFGTMWLASIGLEDRGVAEHAMKRLKVLAPRAHDHTTHDLGFLFHPSVVIGHQCGLLEGAATGPGLEAAVTTVRRYNEAGRFIQAFGPIGEALSAGTSTVDTMMNLPLLWWAHQATGEARFLDVARNHARTSARLLVRPDGSTVHLMRLDPVTGAFLRESTVQGAAPHSAWSRGQAWAVTGMAWSYAVTGEAEMLATSERAAKFFEAHAPAGELPPWDLVDLTEPETDASAAAVLALGYQILAAYHPDGGARRSYAARAEEMLDLLADLALNRDPDRDGILLSSNYSVPHRRGVGGATAWGDFYFGLALALSEGVLSLDQILQRATSQPGVVA